LSHHKSSFKKIKNLIYHPKIKKHAILFHYSSGEIQLNGISAAQQDYFENAVLLLVCFWVITIGAMPTTTLTATPSFQVVLSSKHPITTGVVIKITFFYRNVFFHH